LDEPPLVPAAAPDGVDKGDGLEVPTLDLASRWARLGGALIDGSIALAIMLPIMLVTEVLQQIFRKEPLTLGQQAALFVVGWLVFLMLNGYLLFRRGQTIGKVAVNTRIVDLTGKIPDFGKLLVLRYLVLGLASQIPIIGGFVGLVDALCIFGDERLCLHDYTAGTRVINA
jgi:uncharacterized RDD family membrane protein YckC